MLTSKLSNREKYLNIALRDKILYASLIVILVALATWRIGYDYITVTYVVAGLLVLIHLILSKLSLLISSIVILAHIAVIPFSAMGYSIVKMGSLENYSGNILLFIPLTIITLILSTRISARKPWRIMLASFISLDILGLILPAIAGWEGRGIETGILFLIATLMICALPWNKILRKKSQPLSIPLPLMSYDDLEKFPHPTEWESFESRTRTVKKALISSDKLILLTGMSPRTKIKMLHGSLVYQHSSLDDIYGSAIEDAIRISKETKISIKDIDVVILADKNLDVDKIPLTFAVQSKGKNVYGKVIVADDKYLLHRKEAPVSNNEKMAKKARKYFSSQN